MCCGLCNIWQHIPCHEERDRLDGRPPRDWETEEFYCSRCCPEPSTNGHEARKSQSLYTPPQTKVQLRWDHGRSGTKPPGPTQPYMGLPVERHDHDQPPQALDMTNGGHPYPHHVYNGHPSSLPTSVDQYSNISFSHYQPHQRGFTSRHPQPSAYNSTHYPTTHHSHSQPTHHINPIYPTYANGANDPTLQGYHNQPGYGGHYRMPSSALPLQVCQNRSSFCSKI